MSDAPFSRVKQYFKDGWATRIETVINNPTIFGVLRRMARLDELQAKARDVNRRLLQHEQVGQGCVLAGPTAPAQTQRPECEARPQHHLRPDRRRAALAISYAKIHNRLLRPLLSADRPPASVDVRQALRTLERVVGNDIREARIAA